MLAGVVDIAVAWWLIPTYGAVGACIGSGAGEIVAVGLMWLIGIYLQGDCFPALRSESRFHQHLRLLHFTAHFVAIRFKPLPEFCSRSADYDRPFFGLLYVMQSFEEQDRSRLGVVTGKFPPTE